MSNAAVDRHDTANSQRRAVWVGTVALSFAVIGGSFRPDALFRAYLAAYLFFLGIALGSMALVMVYHLTGGSWGFLIRRILEAGMRTLPLLAVLFLPIAGGIRYLYPWAQPGVVADSPQLQYQQFYLAPLYYWIRAAIYFAVWLALAFWLASWSRQEDQAGEDAGARARLAWKSRQLGAFGAVAYGISLHFAAIDWGMSLQPVFHSTIWGPLFAAGQLLSALAFALVILAWRGKRPPLADVDSPQVRVDLASLLLTLLILWAYMAWFQFMLIWIANLPVDVVWYLPRAISPWPWVMGAIALFHFTVPFFLLLVRRIKRNSQIVAGIAGMILFMHLVFMDYQVLPALPPASLRSARLPSANLRDCWLALLVPIGVGGLWLSRFLWQLERYPLLPLHDANRAATLRLRHLDAEETARNEALLLMDKDAAVAGPLVAQVRGDQVRTGESISVAFRSAKERDFRGAKGDTATVTDSPETGAAEGRLEHPAARYERKDIRIRWLVAVAVGVCCFAVIQYYGVWRFLWFQEHSQAEAKKSPYPWASVPSQTLPPEPRLDQLDRMTPAESATVNRKLAAKQKALHSYGSTAGEGFVQIPIEQAIKAVAGTLPVTKESSSSRAAKGNGLLEAGESNSGRMFRGGRP